jgi:hypothetical protein
LPLREHAILLSARELPFDRLLEAVAQLKLDTALLTSDESTAYLTGSRPTRRERFLGGYNRMLWTALRRRAAYLPG